MSYGIIIINPYSKESDTDYLKKIYKKCQDKFKSCFVCNGDDGKAPSSSEIQNGHKKFHYELYETIQPGIIIEDFFYSYDKKSTKKPKEIKILLIGNKIIKAPRHWMLGLRNKKIKKIVDFVRGISEILGSVLIRIDVFIRVNDKIYEPYLNEISLSPSRGLNCLRLITSKQIDNYKNEILQADQGNYPVIDKLIRECPYRNLKIDRYYTDGDKL